MLAHGWRRIVLAICIAGACAGCRSMLEIPESARARGYSNQDAPDGWLLDRITGRPPTSPAESSLTGPNGAPQVQPVSHLSPQPTQSWDASPPADPSAPPEIESAEEEDSGYSLSDFSPSNILGTLKEIAGYGPNERVAQALYQEGEYLYGQGKYEEAAERFTQAVERAPESPLQEDCLFMQAESQFRADQYPKATETYAELLKKYDNTRYLDTVVKRQFLIGRYWEQLDAVEPAWLLGFQWSDPTRPKLDTWGNAIKAYRSIQMHDPRGPLADLSIITTANAYYTKGRYEDAAYYYDLLRNEYPKSDYQRHAHRDGMKSKLHMYQGPMYDGSPLEDAAQIADQMLLQFGSELGSERDQIIQIQNEILQQRAERDWAVAQFYEKKSHYGAARYYYRLILDEYPTTAVAQKARARLIEIKDRPDQPPNHFKWLTDLLPSTK